MTRPAATLHAGCVLLGEDGILIRGDSGAGKSTLACDLVEAALAAGRFAAHVADDRVRLEAWGGRILARPVPAIAGQVEIRGLGIVRVPHEPAARLRLVVDLTAEPAPRLPEGADLETRVLGIALPRVAGRAGEVGRLILWRIRGLHDTMMTMR